MRQASLWLPQESCSIPVEAISAKPHTTLHSALFCALPIIAQLFLFVKRICSVFCVKKSFPQSFFNYVQNCGKPCGLCGKLAYSCQNTPFFVLLCKKAVENFWLAILFYYNLL